MSSDLIFKPGWPARRRSATGQRIPRFSWLYLACAVALVAGCGTAPKRTTEAAKPIVRDETPRLAILSAFGPELEKLRQETQVSEVEVIHGRSHYLGRLAGQNVVLVLSGYSMVNAALTAQAVLDHFNVRQIIFSGIAGGVNPNLNIGDVTVPAEWGQYQEQLFARETAQGWETGDWARNLGNYGMMFPQPAHVTRDGEGADQEERRFWFPVDQASLQLVRSLTNKVALRSRAGPNDALAAMPRIVVGGRGVSGPTFVDNAAYRRWVWETFQADALDMESAAVATVAYVNRVPFIAFRSLSDLAGGGGAANELPTFLKLAADNSAAVVLGYLEALGATQLGAKPSR